MPNIGSQTELSLTTAISAAMVELYGRVYGHDRTTATTYINDNVVVCILEDILSVRPVRRRAGAVAAGALLLPRRR